MSNQPVREWTRLLGVTDHDNAYSLSIADDGSIYISGETSGNLDGQTNSGSNDAFISKYNSDGSKAWTRLLGSTSYDYATSVSTAADGSIYITGSAGGSIDGQTKSGIGDSFISKYNSDGSKAWTRLLGSTYSAAATSVSAAADGSIYIAGEMAGSLGVCGKTV